MKIKKQYRGSFFTLLLRNYILFTLLIVVVSCVILAVALLRISGKIVESYPEQLMEYNDILAKKQYSKFPTERLFGKNSNIAVLDETNNLTYSSHSDNKKINLSESELFYVPDYTLNPIIVITKFLNAKGENQISVTVTPSSEQNSKLYKEYILDESYNILYQPDNSNKKTLTTREFKLLTGKYENNITISKYKFITDDNKNYTLLIFQPVNVAILLFGKISRIFRDSLLLFFIFYCILIALFVLWLNRKVKKPLSILNNALIHFSNDNGHEKKYLSYNGPREFVKIFDSFNDMSYRLRQSENERKKLEQDKQKMIADISHDLKTPITVIQGYAKAVNDGFVTNEKRSQYLNTISEKADMLNELINTFHEYSKLEHPDYLLTLEPYDICVHLRNYIASKYNELTLSGFNLNIDIPELHLICNIDKLQIKRSFENIVSNCVKHNKRGTTLFCKLIPFDDKVKIILADNGCGIPPEIKETIFEPFTVGEKSRNTHGSGLGLAISKKIVEIHGGHLILVDPPDKGYTTQFQIVLPLLYTI